MSATEHEGTTVRYCYVGVQSGCGCIGAVVVDDPKYAKDTAKSVAEFIRGGMEVSRMPIDDFRKNKEPLGCKNKTSFADCRKRGMNKAAA